MENYKKNSPAVVEAIAEFEQNLADRQRDMEISYLVHHMNGEQDKARQAIVDFTKEMVAEEVAFLKGHVDRLNKKYKFDNAKFLSELERLHKKWQYHPKLIE